MDILKRNNVTILGEENKPTMVFAHGYGCDQNVWQDMINSFSKDYRVVSFDYVGAGMSDLSAYSKERYSSLNGYAQDILEIYESLGLKDTILIAHSVSSMIGLLAGIQKPEYFKSIIFLGPSPRYLNDVDYHGGFEQEDLEGLFEMMDNNYLGWARALAPSIMGNPEYPELGERLTNSFCATDPEIAQQFARVTFLSDNRADLPKLTVPSLTLQCSNDIIAPISVGNYMNENMRNNTLVIMEATGHCPHMSAPGETIAAVRNYLN
ncbi:sigma-B regulation protein RsbQ [Pedobacter sp. AK017]|uniref:alpha/beta fold hydrolase n=1 Tax=Pedobacter sp. AK017 TaxID=2723073 RepID=UPI00185CEE22|nr:alpha/beta hydrolase [Pedobacter sp. AK017]MBB5438125.1 sigma-B regulation protein RsbQ [Pedobacter sp. AK017]